jgi:hypothetical protein
MPVLERPLEAASPTEPGLETPDEAQMGIAMIAPDRMRYFTFWSMTGLSKTFSGRNTSDDGGLYDDAQNCIFRRNMFYAASLAST